MTAPYYTLLTNIGAAKLANATATDTPLNITQMGVGDANGTVPTPDPRQTSLIHECRRADLNTLKTDPNNPNQIIAEQVIPDNVGGWYIRELGLYDADGDLIAVGNCPPSYKPLIEEGASREQVIRMILIVTSDDAVTLKIDPAVVLATREYVDDSIEAHAKSRNHPDATTKAKGLVQLSSDTDSDDETKAATPKAVKAVKATADAAVKTVNNAEPDEHGNVQLGTAADADIVTSMTDTTAGRVPVVGWEGLGGYALQTTDAELQSQNRLPTRFFIQGSGDADKRFGHFGSGVHIEYGTDGNGVEYSSNIFVRADGNIIVEWLQVNADGSVNHQKQQMLFGPFNLPSAADIRAVAVSGVFAKAGTAISDANDLPANAVSFCYADAAHSPGYEATILDVGGLGGYRVQYAICYADGGKQFKFRAFNGDNSTWGAWTNVLTNYGGSIEYLDNAKYYGIKPYFWQGSGAFANQYDDGTAPFYVPRFPSPRDISIYYPLVKGSTLTADYGYGTTISFGILQSGEAKFGNAIIHIATDDGGGAVFQFDAHGDFFTPGQVVPGDYANFDTRYARTIIDAIGSGGGWQQDSSGLIMQMGVVNRVGPSTGVTFPRAFPNYCIGVLLTLNMYIGSLKDSDANIRVLSHDQNGFSYGAAGEPETTSFWVAFGK